MNRQLSGTIWPTGNLEPEKEKDRIGKKEHI